VIDKEIELLIRAQIEKGKDLDSVVKSIERLEEAIDKQSAAAKRGESSIDELKATLLELQQVQDRLKSTARLIDDFSKLSDRIAKTGERVDRTAAAYEKYATKLQAVESVTDRQQERLTKLSLANERAKKSFDTQTASLEALGDTLRKAGIDTNDLAASQNRILNSAARLGATIAKTQGSISTYADDVRRARDSERQLAQEDAFQQKLKDAAQLAKSSQYISFWTNALDEADRAEKELAGNRALKQAGDEAEKAAKGYNTLARAASSLSPKVKSLRDAVDQIVDPARAARSTLGGLEGEIKDLSKTIGSISGPVREYRDLLSRLVSAQKELSRQSGLVDNFRQQLTALRAARAEYRQARAQVLEYATAVRQGGQAGEQYVQSLERAQTRARQAAQALAQQVTTTRTARDAVRAAGIATNDLAGAQARLTASAQQTVATTQRLTAANQQYGEAVERTTRAKLRFNDGGRTTLSYLQRLRGEVLSLVAAYGGLFGAINLAKGSIDALISQQGIENRLAVGLDTNDARAIGKEFQYVESTADRLGFGVKDLANSYSSFLVASKNANLSTDQTRFSFEQISGAMRVLKLNTDQSSRAWVQLNQILSKNKPELEDIKTIAESGFVGVQTTMAKGLRELGVAGIRAGNEVNDMFELMKKGALDSRVAVFALAVGAEKEYGGRLAQAIKTVQAEQGRFETQVFNFQKEIANSGWADAYTDALKEIAAFLQSDDGKRFAQSASDAFAGLARALIFVLENFEAVKTVAMTFIALFAANSLRAGAERLIFLGKAARGAAVGVGLLARAFAAFNLIILAIGIGKFLYDEFEVVRDVIDKAITWIAGAGAAMKVSIEATVKNLPAVFKNIFAAILNTVTFGIRNLLGIFAKLASAVGLDSLERALKGTVDMMTVNYAKVEESFSDTTARMSAEFKRVRAETEAALKAQKDARRKGEAVEPASEPGVTPRPGAPGSRLNGEDDPAKAAAKRARLIEELTRSLETLEAKIDRAQTDTLSSQLDAIDKQYAALKRKIGTLGGEEGAIFAKRLNEAVAQLRTQTIKKFNDGLAKEREALNKKLESLDAAAGRKDKLSLEARQQAIATSYASYYRELEELRAKFVENGRDTSELDAAKVRIDAGIAELQRLEALKFGREELRRQEERINDLVQNREKLISAVNAEREAGIIDDVQAAERINTINAQAIPAIQAAANATKEWAIANAAIFQRPEDLAVFIATLDAVTARIAASKTQFTVLEQTIISGSVNLINNGLNAMVDSLQQVFNGQMSIRDGFKSLMASFGQFVASFLRDIALMIIKLMIFKALAGSGNPVLAGVGKAGLGSMGVKHSGGVIGRPGGRVRRVSTALFANAPRYHNGGLPGLASDEYATILQKNEEVLAADSPRNILNGGAGLGGAQPTERGLRLVLVDDRAKVAEAMASAEGDDVIVQSIRRNAPTIKQFLKG
jgi:DNA repair ATPase RecN